MSNASASRALLYVMTMWPDRRFRDNTVISDGGPRCIGWAAITTWSDTRVRGRTKEERDREGQEKRMTGGQERMGHDTGREMWRLMWDDWTVSQIKPRNARGLQTKEQEESKDQEG